MADSNKPYTQMGAILEMAIYCCRAELMSFAREDPVGFRAMWTRTPACIFTTTPVCLTEYMWNKLVLEILLEELGEMKPEVIP